MSIVYNSIPTQILNIINESSLRATFYFDRQFAVSLSIVLVLEIVAGVAAFALRDGVTIYLYHAMWDMMEDYKSNADIAKAVDFVQTTVR